MHRFPTAGSVTDHFERPGLDGAAAGARVPRSERPAQEATAGGDEFACREPPGRVAATALTASAAGRPPLPPPRSVVNQQGDARDPRDDGEFGEQVGLDLLPHGLVVTAFLAVSRLLGHGTTCPGAGEASGSGVHVNLPGPRLRMYAPDRESGRAFRDPKPH